MTSIDKIVIVVDETDEREFIVTIGGREVRVSADALLSQNKFAMEVLKQTDRLWRKVGRAEYQALIDGALESAEHLYPVEKPPMRVALLMALNDFIVSKRIPKGTNDALLFTGRVIWSQDELEATFKFDQFLTFLKARGYSWSPNIVSKVLVHELGIHVRGSTHVAGKQVRPYLVNVPALNRLVEALDDGN